MSNSFSPPAQEVKQELIRFLEEDESLYGVIYRKKQEGLSNEDIQRGQEASSPNFIWNYERYMRALLEADIPRGISLMNGAAGLFRKVLKVDSISDGAREYLTLGLQEMAERRENPALLQSQQIEVLKSSKALEKISRPGIYVYSYMHYLNYPYDATSGRTLMKVGMSERNVIQRFREQTRTTAVPEEPVLLRVYEAKDGNNGMLGIERNFHDLLEAADHDRSSARTGGTEWFLTSLRFLDKIGETLQLNVTTNRDLDELI